MNAFPEPRLLADHTAADISTAPPAEPVERIDIAPFPRAAAIVAVIAGAAALGMATLGIITLLP